jgi:hypothetical protein
MSWAGELQAPTSAKETTWFKEQGLGLPSYVSTFAPVQDGGITELSLREYAACGLDQAFVDMVASIDFLRLDGYSEKVHGAGANGQGYHMALKAPRGEGLLNVGVLLSVVVRITRSTLVPCACTSPISKLAHMHPVPIRCIQSCQSTAKTYRCSARRHMAVLCA